MFITSDGVAFHCLVQLSYTSTTDQHLTWQRKLLALLAQLHQTHARYFYIRDPTKAKQLSILHIADIDNLADIVIKVLPFDTFIKSLA